MTAAFDVTRRALLAAPLSGLALAAARAGTPRIAAIDWAALETLLAIGVAPVAAAELILYRAVVVEPALPPGVADLGLRGSPNYEALWAARPDLILSSDFYVWAEPKLRLIAPVERLSVYVRGRAPYGAAEEMTRTIGRLAERPAAAEALIAGTRDELERLRGRLAGLAERRLIPVNFGDPRHFRVFGTDSMFGEVLARLGLDNAWGAGTSYSASAPIGLEALAGIGDAWIVVVPPIPPDTRRALAQSVFWAALPNVRAGRVLVLEPINPFGALPAALRFGRLVAAGLTAPGGGRGLG
ncbi:iron-siderophore ABC transporter substrate-binding protein [Chelatococcus reniformis]|uniref:Amino acid ABC transporter substrate-binding protein n=1 Tax=Chelatococcus reniformis TaxID=1494448 RepID=A0A916UQH3_9HYPH|nr:iron-siderophore ABC transporter substrate-binding protein [Chelatococcus reniformis]GGC82076.1 amino acid ABC transporter substrate-binding protein [Chelatococcus reniformis]